MDEGDPKKFIEELNKEKDFIIDKIKKLEESIKDNETKYLQDTVNGGNILRGWEHIFTTKSTKNYMGNQPKKTHISNAERLFSQTFEVDKNFDDLINDNDKHHHHISQSVSVHTSNTNLKLEENSNKHVVGNVNINNINVNGNNNIKTTNHKKKMVGIKRKRNINNSESNSNDKQESQKNS